MLLDLFFRLLGLCMKAFYGTFINAIDFGSLIALILSIAGSLAFVYVAVKAARVMFAMLRGS